METTATLPKWRVRLMQAHEHETIPTGKTKPISEHAAVAKMVRSTLKKVFPGVSFSVTSESYAGGDAITAHWTDGPTEKMVGTIIGRHEQGHFDGSIDLYEYSNSRDDIPQVKYTSAVRHMSPQTVKTIITELNRYWGYELIFDPQTNWVDHSSDKPRGNGSGWQSQDIWRTFVPLCLVCLECDWQTQPHDKFCEQCGSPLAADNKS